MVPDQFIQCYSGLVYLRVRGPMHSCMVHAGFEEAGTDCVSPAAWGTQEEVKEDSTTEYTLP